MTTLPSATPAHDPDSPVDWDVLVVVGGAAEQGPILSLFQTELLATQQYPEQFGEFPGFGERPDEPLFDRRRVAEAITGA